MVQAFGRFDVHVARYVLYEQEPSQAVVFKTLLEICKNFVAEVREALLPLAHLVAIGWDTFGAKTLSGDSICEGDQAQASTQLLKTQENMPSRKPRHLVRRT